MKKHIHSMALLASLLLLQACGGSMLDEKKDTDRMVPDPVVDDGSDRPRPSPNAPVLKVNNDQILNSAGQPVLLRGINLQYGDSPFERFDGISAIADTGSNTIRILLRENTTANDLEAALVRAVQENMIAVVSLWEPEGKLYCTESDTFIHKAMSDLWLNRWLPVLVQDRFQPYLMINIASGWGPKNIFDGYSTGYRSWVDTYKAFIRQFRNAGFNVPLVIDAPGCGQDYNAFLSNRGRELLAADNAKNLVLSVHGYGSTWNTGEKTINAIQQLTAQRMPVLMSEFGGSGLGDEPIKHMAILEKGAGDYALEISIPWQTSSDKLAINVPLDEAVNLTNTEVSFDVMLDDSYIDDANMGVVMYLRDVNNRYANLGWNTAGDFAKGRWNTKKYTVKNSSSFNWAEDNFDVTQVAKLGMELVANNKSAEILGSVKIDNLKIIQGADSGPAVTYSEDFDGTTGGWVATQWEGKPVGISEADGALLLAPQAEVLEAGVRGLTSSGVDFSQPVTINARIFFPASLGSGFYMAFYALDGSWSASNYIGDWAVNMGEWNDVTFTADFSSAGNSGIAIQLGGYPEAAWADALKIDHIEIVGVAGDAPSEFEQGIQYRSAFDSDADGWESLVSWGGVPVDMTSENGELKITPRASGEGTHRIVLNKSDIGRVEKLSFAQDPFIVKTSIQLPASYEGSEYSIEFLIQDSTWNVDVSKVWATEDIAVGEKINLVWEVDFINDVTKGSGFDRAGMPRYFVINIYGAANTDPVWIGDVTIEGMVPVEKEDIVVGQIDFHYISHFANLAVDFVEGGLIADQLNDIFNINQRSAPFSWLAWSWFGNSVEFADWDLTRVLGDAGALTPRGEEILSGKGGLQETAVPVYLQGE